MMQRVTQILQIITSLGAVEALLRLVAAGTLVLTLTLYVKPLTIFFHSICRP
jgi:hypothetical protein